MKQTLLIAQKLGDYALNCNYAGYDPYDMLNSPLSGILSLGTRWGRIAMTQFGRRSPVNLRPLFLIKRGVNPKAVALFLEGYAKLHKFAPDEVYKERMRSLAGLLDSLRSPGVSGAAWGYNFPWQNRIQCLKRYTPTIVNSAFAGHALLDYYELTGEQRALDMAMSIPDFMLNDLNRKQEGDSFCFSYTPCDQNFVHNANMLGASLMARLGKVYGRTELLDPALQALSYSMRHQHDDGSWFYAETRAQSWIDSFHTGFNLEALKRFIELGLTPEYAENYQRGVDFYANNFFLEDGTAKYFHDRLYLVDIHAPAEALTFFSAAGSEYRVLVEKVGNWTLKNMYNAKSGLFYFRKAKYFTIRTPYLRWSEAWAFRAMTSCATAGGKKLSAEILSAGLL